MKRISIVLLKVLTLTILFSAIIYIFIRLDPNFSTEYIKGIDNKYNRLKQVASPKIVFLGGSNLAFGLDSAKIERELNMPVVNMGLHASLGLEFYLNFIKNEINRDDIIIIVPEYSLFTSKENYIGFSNTEVTSALFHTPEKINILFYDSQQLGKFLIQASNRLKENYFRYIKYGTKPVNLNSVYNSNSFNEYGDVVSHLGKKSVKITNKEVKNIDFLQMGEVSKHLNDYNKYVKQKGAKLYFMYPVIMKEIYKESTLAEINKGQKQALDFPILGTPLDFQLEERYFFDSYYHLNEEGRNIRTEKIIELLREALRTR